MAREANGSGRIGLKCAKSACTPLCDKCVPLPASCVCTCTCKHPLRLGLTSYPKPPFYGFRAKDKFCIDIMLNLLAQIGKKGATRPTPRTP